MTILFFENSPRIILNVQSCLRREDRWYATMDEERARALIGQGEVELIVVRRCHEHAFWHVMGIDWSMGMPGGQQLVVLPRMGGTRYLRRYLHSQQSHAGGNPLL